MRTTNLIAGFTVTALLFTAVASAADPRLTNLVMPEATTVAGINLTNAEITPFGQYVLNQVASSIATDPEFQKFVAETGFDPRRDVSEILAASSGNLTKPTGLVLALGNFQVPQITAIVATQAKELTVQTYNGATFITGSDKSNFSVAFLGSTIAIIGDTASVKAAIDRSSHANSLSPALATQVQALSTTQDAWVATTNSFTSLIPGLGAAPAGAPASPFSGVGQLFSSIQSSSGGVKFGSTVAITGQALTNDAAAAKSLADLATGLVALVSMAGPAQDPQAGALIALLQGLKVTASGTTINIALSVPEAQLEAALNGLKNQMKPAAKPTTLKPAVFHAK